MVRNRWLLLAIALFAASAFARDLPDKTRTPGVANPDVTQDNIDQTICVSGWTKKIRPPTNYTNELKQQQIVEYGYTDKNPGDYEENHPISFAAWVTQPFHHSGLSSPSDDLVQSIATSMDADREQGFFEGDS